MFHIFFRAFAACLLLTAAVGLLGIYAWKRHSLDLYIANAQRLAAMIGADSIGPRDRLEPRRIERALGALNSQSMLTQAFVYNADGSLVVQRRNDNALTRTSRPMGKVAYAALDDRHYFKDGITHVLAPIGPDASMGVVELAYDLSAVGLDRRHLIGPIAFVLGCSLLVSAVVTGIAKRYLRDSQRLANAIRTTASDAHDVTVLRPTEGWLAPAWSALAELSSRQRLKVAQKVAQSAAAPHEHDLELAQMREQLAELQSRTEASARIKAQFLANMSHEIRTPMNGILGMTELLLGTQLTVKQHRFAETVRRSAESLLHIINDILDFSKMETGKLALEHVDFDVRETIEEVVELLAEKAHGKGLELACHIADDMRNGASGDPGRLRQVLINIIDNAIKFTETGEVLIKVKSHDEVCEKVRYTIEIIDTGIGMSAGVQSRIFDSFAQADASTTRRYGGAGLGLTISHELISLMGGEIKVHSKPGEGSRFEISALLATSDVLSNPTSADRAALEGLRVLCVDDNETNRSILSHQLSAWNVIHDCASDGAAALSLLHKASRENVSFDIAILDMHMPNMDGLELARTISSDPNLSNMSLALLTSAVLEVGATELKEAGITQYISKPARQSQLYNTLLAFARSGRSSPITRAYSKPALPEKSLLGVRILLAEDNPVNQEVAASMLEIAGCEVTIVDNGRSAVEVFGKTEFDVILMDCQMPDMDGFEATSSIRELESSGNRSRTPIVALTANALEGDRERCLSADMDDYVSKPFKQEQLRLCLAGWVQSDARAEPGQVSHETPTDEAGGASDKHQDSRIDTTALDNIRALQRPDGPDILAKVTNIYLDKTPQLLTSLGDALGCDDTKQVHINAHTLKSSSANLGANGLAALFREIEEIARSGSLDGVKEIYTEALLEYEAASTELATLTEERREPA